MPKWMKTGCFLFSLLLLASCASKQKQVEEALEKTIPYICTHVDTVHAAFTIAVVFGKIDEKTQDKELAAFGAVKVFCASSSDATIPGVALRARKAYKTYLQIIEQAS